MITPQSDNFGPQMAIFIEGEFNLSCELFSHNISSFWAQEFIHTWSLYRVSWLKISVVRTASWALRRGNSGQLLSYDSSRKKAYKKAANFKSCSKKAKFFHLWIYRFYHGIWGFLLEFCKIALFSGTSFPENCLKSSKICFRFPKSGE